MPIHSDLRIFWILSLLAASVVLVIIELFHPAGFTEDPGMFDFLRMPMSPAHDHSHHALDYFGPNWWFWLHMIQTPCVAMVSLGLMLTVRRWMFHPSEEYIYYNENTLVLIFGWLALLGLFVFLVYYTVLDSIGGIGLGRTLVLVNHMQTDGDLSANQLAGIAKLLNKVWIDPLVGGVGSWVSLTGSWAFFFATLFAAATALLRHRLRTNYTLWFALLCLVAGGWFVQLSHACCTGPIGFGLIFLFGCAVCLQTYRRKE